MHPVKNDNKPVFSPLSWLTSLDLTVAGLAILAVLVVWGTLYSVENGIYAAQERFFRTWFVQVKGIPVFPAVKTIIALLSVNFIAVALKRVSLKPENAGLIILHFGVVVLIGGSALASKFTVESAINLAQGQGTDTTYNFSSWRLSVVLKGKRDGKPYEKRHFFDIRRLKQGKRIALTPAAAVLSVRRLYRNCVPVISPNDSVTIIGLRQQKNSKEEGRDIPGIVFSLGVGGGNGFSESAEYYLYGGSLYGTPFAIGEDTIILSLQPLAIPLPVRVVLTKFTAEWHPGTEKAKRFQSRLHVSGKDIDREAVIEMNRPFRYRSFTFYQMGYSGEEGNYSSTLAIVKNPFRYIPYIASCIIVLGMLMHFIIKMQRFFVSRKGDK